MDFAGGVACFDGIGSWQNQASGAGLQGGISEAELERLIAFYGERGVEPKLVLASYGDGDVLAHLARRGFTLREIEHVWVYDLEKGIELSEGHREPAPDGLSFEFIDRQHPRVDEFVEVSTCGFRPIAEPVPEVLKRGVERGLALPGGAGVIASLGDQGVGAGSVSVDEGVAELFGTSVMPDFRRRGIQRALIHERLRFAQARECTLASIATHPGISTESNARRVGFTLGYVRLAFALAGEGWAVSL